MKLLITGYTSSIAKELIKIIKENSNTELFLAGRKKDSSFYCDFSDFFSIKNFISEIIHKNHFDYIFLNHGILLGKKALELSEKEINDYMMVNCFSIIAILEALKNYKNTNIVVTSSISSKEGSYDPIYSATKAAVDSFRIRSGLIFDSSVRLNFISPGVIEDALMTTSRNDKDNIQSILNTTPTNKLTNSFEVAKLVYFLLLEPGNIHCQDIAINGGLSLNK